MSGAEIERPAVEGRVLCDTREAECRCREPRDHDGPHVCPCGGSWKYDADGRFEVVEWPPGFPVPGLERGATW